MVFKDREEAARRLVQLLGRFRESKPLVLGVPRGAVPMAKIIADGIGGELDIILVHKFGHPQNPEYALGSVTEEGAVFLGSGAERMGLSEADITESAISEIEKLREKRRLLTPDREPIGISGRVAIIVDDGIATGATMTAAVRAVFEKGAAKVVVATPVASGEAVQRLEAEGAEVIAASVPEIFFAVSQFFEKFEQVEDQEVVAALASTRRVSRDLVSR